MKYKQFRIYILTFVFILLPIIIFANNTIKLTFDPSPDERVIGHKIYIGEESGNYTQSYDLGNNNYYFTWELPDNKSYYYAATAYGDIRFCNENANLYPCPDIMELPEGTMCCHMQDTYIKRIESVFSEELYYPDKLSKPIIKRIELKEIIK